MAKTGRPKSEKPTVASTFVRLNAEDHALILKAIQKQSIGIVGAQIKLAAFLRAAGLQVARQILNAD